MDGQEEDNLSPFWLQNTNPRRRLRRRDSFSLIFNSGFILILLLAIAFVLIFVIIPSCLSFTAKIVKPHLVKRGWDSLNLVLVLFAIICAFLSKTSNSNTSSSRSNDNNSAVSSSSYYVDRNMYGEATNEAQKSNPSTPQSNDRWYDFPDRTAYKKLNRLRSGRSYPDLRQELSWVTGDERWRFYDDTFVSQRSDQWLHESEEVRENRTGSTKEVEVDNSASINRQKEASLPPPTSLRPAPEPLAPQPQAPPVAIQSSQQQQPPQSSQSLLSKAVRRKAKRRHAEEDNGGEGGSEKKDEEVKNVINQLQPSPATPPSSPPPPPVSSNGGKKRGKDILTSLRRRKKKQRQKSVENLESLFDPQLHNLPLQPPPSPPPPPPQPAFLQGIFSSKKGKAKKVHSVRAAAPPAPPSPPPPRVSRNVYHSAQSLDARVLTTKAQSVQAAAIKAPKPVKTGISNFAADENLDSGNASPLIPIPPPPPPPPFKMPVWRYVVEGDYVRLKSISRSASPELEDPSDKESSPSAMDGTSSPLFCPSPDVNTKADNFIARFKETLRLEKAKSINDRRRSNLGPETTQGPAIEGPS